MFASAPLATTQFASTPHAVGYGYYAAFLEDIIIDDVLLKEYSLTLTEEIVVNDLLTKSTVREYDDSIEVCANVLTLDPSEGTQVGLWTRTPKIKTIWTKPCN